MFLTKEILPHHLGPYSSGKYELTAQGKKALDTLASGQSIGESSNQRMHEMENLNRIKKLAGLNESTNFIEEEGDALKVVVSITLDLSMIQEYFEEEYGPDSGGEFQIAAKSNEFQEFVKGLVQNNETMDEDINAWFERQLRPDDLY